MGQDKKRTRARFRDACYQRDAFRCRMCGAQPPVEELDAHHITDRTLMPNGGYVAENGITLCRPCHALAEEFHQTGTAHPGYAPEDLYRRIGSDVERARRASERLG
jgi:5-methylcytosine-specific restriction endonuclease McrA